MDRLTEEQIDELQMCAGGHVAISRKLLQLALSELRSLREENERQRMQLEPLKEERRVLREENEKLKAAGRECVECVDALEADEPASERSNFIGFEVNAETYRRAVG